MKPLSESEVIEGLDELENSDEIDVEVRDGEKYYRLNKKGRERLSKESIEALGKLDFKISTKGIEDFENYIEKGNPNKFVHKMISELLPFVMERKEKGMSDEDIKKEVGDLKK